MITVWPRGCVCHAVRAPGSNVTLPPLTRAGSGAWNSGSTRTVPVKYSAGPLRDGCEPPRVICIAPFLPCGVVAGGCAAAAPTAVTAARLPLAARTRLRVIMLTFPAQYPAARIAADGAE